MLKDTRHKFDPMIETRIARQVVQRSGRSRLWVKTAEYYCRDAGQYNSSHAHRAGLKGDIKSCIKESPGLNFPRLLMAINSACPDGSCVVSRRLWPRVTIAAHRNNNAPDRHLILGLRLAGFGIASRIQYSWECEGGLSLWEGLEREMGGVLCVQVSNRLPVPRVSLRISPNGSRLSSVKIVGSCSWRDTPLFPFTFRPSLFILHSPNF